jgi:hypothetical protein
MRLSFGFARRFAEALLIRPQYIFFDFGAQLYRTFIIRDYCDGSWQRIPREFYYLPFVGVFAIWIDFDYLGDHQPSFTGSLSREQLLLAILHYFQKWTKRHYLLQENPRGTTFQSGLDRANTIRLPQQTF